MTDPRESETGVRVGGEARVERIRFAVQIGAASVSSIGALVLIGWWSGIEPLRRLPPDPIVMLPNTAVGFIAAGIALWLACHRAPGRSAARVFKWLSLGVLIWGLVAFLERMLGADVGIDRLLFADAVARYPYRPLGLMATNSGLCFTLAGIGLLLVDVRTRGGRRPSEIFALLGAGIAALALVGHLYDARPLYAIDAAAGMALITAVAFALLHSGILLLRPTESGVALLTGEDLGGVLIRRLLPATISVPLVLGWLFIVARESSLVTREGGIALLSVFTVFVLIALVVRSAHALRATDRERAALLHREQAARADAEQANRAKMQFLATMSHELRTPLNAIDGYAELLEMGLRGPVTPQQAEDLARIRRSERHLLSLVNDMLNFAKLEAGRVEWQLEPVALAPVLVDAEKLLRPQIEAKRIAFTNGAMSPVLVLADAEKLRQVIVNVLGNAIKFTPAGGSVWIEQLIRDLTVEIVVGDDGRGIPAEKLEAIFDPFVQVDRHLTASSQQGVGLGLAISRELARGMEGELTAESTVGQGSTFRLTLRRADQPPGVRQRAPSAPMS